MVVTLQGYLLGGFLVGLSLIPIGFLVRGAGKCIDAPSMRKLGERIGVFGGQFGFVCLGLFYALALFRFLARML